MLDIPHCPTVLFSKGPVLDVLYRYHPCVAIPPHTTAGSDDEWLKYTTSVALVIEWLLKLPLKITSTTAITATAAKIINADICFIRYWCFL